MDEETVPDFSELPDVAWVLIMQYLPIDTRFHLARTCKRLYEIFNHPSLWYSQDLLIFGDTDFYSTGSKATPAVAPVKYEHLIKRFGKYIQDLTITISGHFKDIPNDIKAALNEVGKECRLQKLTIDTGPLTSFIHDRWGERPKTSAVDAIAMFVRNAYRLKELDIRSWPMHRKIRESNCNIFESIISNEKLGKHLECLTMFWLEKKDWSERDPILPDPELTKKILEACPNLTSIAVRSPMIDRSVLEALCIPGRSKLNVLRIVVHYISGNSAFIVPTISSHTWQALRRSSPTFRVEITVLLKTQHIELANLLTPEVPLSSIVYMKYAKIDSQTIVAMASNYKQTLTTFHSFCDSYNVDQELLHMVKACTDLTEFIYHGNIKVSTAILIARTRGSQWKKFELKVECLEVPDEYEDVGEDQVLSERGGQLVLVSLMRFHQPEEYKQRIVEETVVEISKALDTPWKPLNY